MQNPNISSSSISDASEIRYQKAVRQISKLIGTNNSIKKDAQNFRIMCENLQIQNQQLFQGYEQSVKQRHQVQQKVAGLQAKIKELQTINQNLMKKQQSLLTQSMLQEERKKNQEQIQICHQKLNEQGHTIILLQQFLAQLQKQNKDLKSANQKLQSQLQKEIELKIKKINFEDCVKCPETNKKMHEAIEWRQKLQQQNIQLRKRLAFIVPPNLQNQVLDSKPNNYKDYLIASLQQTVRTQNEKKTRLRIMDYKKQAKIQKLQNQVQFYKQRAKQMKQKTVQTTTMLNGDSYKLK